MIPGFRPLVHKWNWEFGVKKKIVPPVPILKKEVPN
jgi:hypothetical protein